MKPIETIIFDMDGVIVDSEPIHMKLEQEIFRELELDISHEEHRQFVGTSAREMWEKIIGKYQLDIPAEEVQKKKQERYLNHLATTDSLKPLEGIKELIDHLYDSNKQLVLASSSTGEEIERVLVRLNLNSYFSFAISGAELERSKPDPEIFFKAARLSRTGPDQCCVIEDSQNGVRAAKAAGMRCIGFRNPNSGNQDLNEADLIIDSFKAIDIDSILINLSETGS